MTLDQRLERAPTLGEMVFGDGTPKKAFLTAVVVGTILTAINHGDVIVSAEVPSLLKVALTYCVPYCVTTWGAVIGKRTQWLRDHAEQDAAPALNGSSP